MKRLLAIGLAVVTAVALSGCSSQDPLRAGSGGGGAIVVGSADFTESELLMHIYAGALRATGAEVRTRGRIGAREFYVDAVRQGELTVIPDYTGNLLSYLEPETRATEPKEVHDELRTALPPELEVLEYSKAQDKDVLTVTRETAATGVRSMADLGPRCDEFVLGAPAEWKQRWAAEIERTYGCTFKRIRSLESGAVTVDALTSNRIQVANLFTTSAAIDANNLVELGDPEQMFPAQNVVPLVRKGELGRAQVAALNKVSAALSTEKLTDMNRRIQVDKASPVEVAERFLSGIGV